MENNQKDLVLSINEFAYVLDETKGHVSCLVGPTKMSLSQSDKLVIFNSTTKAFEPCNYRDAKHLFITAPENWYVILKNPVENNKHPQPGTSNTLPENMKIGEKINIQGPVSFALYPGQMAKVVKGHALRSNQYLLARVYEAENANRNQGEILDTEGNKIKVENNYVNGQILVIKGTEVSFYIPPTGIEVIPVKDKEYVRDAVTLERLEYCILKDEDGNKRYVHGPEVVFPEPTETFVTSPKGGLIFKAIELSKISGVYVKVIAKYTDENNVEHPVGEELFITGDNQMIYYPRPEHAIISYDGKFMHHAIAIPEGEGRYVMNRMTGEITTVKGPAMFLPDPRTQVIVKRKLSKRECELLYPGNDDVLHYNINLTEKAVEKAAKNCTTDYINVNTISTSSYNTLANLETKASISRGTSYTKPRTITLDNKYDGVVEVNVWTGYAVNVVSKNGDRKVVCGPQSILLDYDQTLSELQMSSGKPKTTDRLIHTAYLRYENNKISDIIDVETKDFVKASIKLSYCVDFLLEYKDKWFNVENYVKYLCDRERSLIKREAKKYTIDEFYQNYATIVRNIVTDNISTTEAESSKPRGRLFKENGMLVYDVDILNLVIQDDVAELLENHQYVTVKKNMELAAAEKRIEITKKLSIAEEEENKLLTQQLINKMSLQREEALKKVALQAEVNRAKEEERKIANEAEKDIQPLIEAVHAAKLQRDKDERQAEIDYQLELAKIQSYKQEQYAQAVAKALKGIEPGLIEALTSKANAQMLDSVSKGLAPYAMAQGESVSDFINTLLRGTTLENVLNKLKEGD